MGKTSRSAERVKKMCRGKRLYISEKQKEYLETSGFLPFFYLVSLSSKNLYIKPPLSVGEESILNLLAGQGKWCVLQQCSIYFMGTDGMLYFVALKAL